MASFHSVCQCLHSLAANRATNQWRRIEQMAPAWSEQRGNEEPMNTVTPEEVGLSSERLEHLRAVMQSYVDEGKLAGLISLVARRGKVAHLECYGMMDIEANKPMHYDTRSSQESPVKRAA
jgi:hypothetical protein